MKCLSKFLVIAVCFVLVACSGNEVNGNGKISLQKRKVSEYSKVEVAGNFVVSANANEPDSKVGVQADENLIPYIVTSVANNTLKIAVKKGFRLKPTRPVQLTLGTKALASLALKGKSTVLVNGLSGSSFNLMINGLGACVLKGEVESSTIETNGSAHVNAVELNADVVHVKVNGLGKVSVAVSKALYVQVDGLGQVTYFGNPPKIDQEIYGGGKLIKG